MNLSTPAQDFFTAGGTLPLESPSYIERPADEELFRHINAREFCYVLTPRQMGKSSLMSRVSHRLKNEGFKTATIDLSGIGTVNDPDRWYKGILWQVKSRLNITTDPLEWWEQEGDIPSTQKFIGFFDVILKEVKEEVVIFIDEIDTTLRLNFRGDFFAGIRSMYNARADQPDFKRLTFVLLGVATPSDLINDVKRTPFNIGKEISVKPFTRTDAKVLEKGLEAAYPTHGKAILDRIFYWTNGHPFLTQKLCHSAVEQHFLKWGDSEIDQLVEKNFLSKDASNDTNLNHIRDNILEHPSKRDLLSTYEELLKGEQIDEDKKSLIQNQLKLLGLALVEHGSLVISNLIYRSVFSLGWLKSTQRRLVGRHFKNYVVLEILSEGQYSLTLKAKNIITNNLVVLKAFERGNLTENAQQAFTIETNSLQILESGHGVKTPIDSFEQDGIFFIVTNYVRGGNLRELLNIGLSVTEILDVFTQIAQAIDYIHSKNIIHRDIKPENILYSKDGGRIIVYLTDFGIARVLTDLRKTSFSTQTISGTFRYLAPESWERESRKTSAVDIYAFGIMLYEALEGKAPFDAESLASIVSQHLWDKPPVPTNLLRYGGSYAVNVLLVALDKRPERRPKTATELMSNLSKAINGQKTSFMRFDVQSLVYLFDKILVGNKKSFLASVVILLIAVISVLSSRFIDFPSFSAGYTTATITLTQRPIESPGKLLTATPIVTATATPIVTATSTPIVTATSTPYKTIYNGFVNCRSGPGNNFSIVITVRGQVIIILAKDSFSPSWLFVQIEGGQVCWLNNAILNLPSSNLALLPSNDSLTPRPTFTLPPSCNPAAPNLNGNRNGQNVSLLWNSVSGATSYEVFRSVNGGATFASIGTTNNTSMKDTISTNKTHVYFVVAINSCGSNSSNEVTITR